MANLMTRFRKRAGNPFRVYPVATLQSVDDVYSWTVSTPGIEIVSTEIARFKKPFESSEGGPAAGMPLVLGVIGPPGSGKTHLILFARGKLERELRGMFGLALLLRAAELPWQQFYTTVCAGALRELNLSRLFIELLAREAIVVARALPATASKADEIAEKPARCFEFIRRGELSATDVELRYRAAIDELCPDGSADLRAVLGSLHKRELNKIALEWLSGNDTGGPDLQRLGADRRMQLQVDAIPAFGALTGLCRRLGRVFMLCLDELERLTDWRVTGADPNISDRSNIEWLRKLAEAVAGNGGVLIIAGQERAWANQPIDVLDRLAARPLIALTAWDAAKVSELVHGANEAWGERWSEEAFERVSALAGGNIRRIQTILFEVFARTAEDEDRKITPDDVQLAAQRLRPLINRLDLLDPIARAAEGCGATVERLVSPIEGGLVFDLLVRKSGIPHLVARKVTVSDEGELARSGVETWQHLNRLRQEKGYLLHCLLIVHGASEPELLATLDRHSALTVIDGDAPEAEEKARAATVARMAEPASTDPTPAPASDLDVAAQTIEIAERSEEAKIAQRSRLAEAYPELGGEAGAFSVADLDVASAVQSREEVERLRIVQRFADQAEEKPRLRRFALDTLMSMPISMLAAAAVALIVLALITILSLTGNISIFGYIWGSQINILNILITMLTSNVLILIFGLAWLRKCFDRRDQVRRAQRKAFNVIHELMLRGAQARELARARTQLEDLIFRNSSDLSDFDTVLEGSGYLYR